MKRQYSPWLKAFSGLCINISATWFAITFVGTNIAFPANVEEFFALTVNITFGILFLFFTVWCERKLEK